MFSIFESSKVFISLPKLILNAPKGDGHTVIVIPGFCAGKHSTLVLRYALSKVGYNTVDWGQGLNFGPDATLEQNLTKLVLEHSKTHKVTIIGWSLGGLYARAIANLYPNNVRRVITLGTPVTTDTDSVPIKKLFDMVSPTKLDHIDKTFLKYSVKEPRVPVINFYTKTDGVVNYKDCITHGRNTVNVEVSGSHMGLTHNVMVYENILRFLPNR